MPLITGVSYNSCPGWFNADFNILSNPLDPNSISIQYYNTHLKFNEGYWSTGSTGPVLVDQNLLLKTFSTCSAATIYGNEGVSRVFAKSTYGMHGSWHYSWGLYNTVRAISANNAYVKIGRAHV